MCSNSGDWNTKKLTSKAFAQGLAIVDLSNEAAEMAMRQPGGNEERGSGHCSGSSRSGDWRGRADVLLRVEQPEKPSRLGNWSYEVVDCKLARETKAETILQLCLYSELVTELQGLQPELFHVIRPNVGFAARVLSAVCLCRILPRREEWLCRRRESWFAAEHIPSRSVIAISAGGGKNATPAARR